MRAGHLSQQREGADSLAFSVARQAKSSSGRMKSMETAFTISVNGETRNAKSGASVTDLLREPGLDRRRVAIEGNLENLPRPQWTQTLIAKGRPYATGQFA